MARQKFDVTEGPLLKKTILFTIPLILTSLLQLLFNAADLMVVGSVSEIYVGAVGSTGAVTNLIVNLFIGLAGGISVIVAQRLGAREYDGVHRAVHTAIPVAVIGGIFLTVIGFFYTRPMLEIMGTPDELIGYSEIYMKIYFCGMVFNLLYNFGAAILRASGDTKSPLYYLTIAGVINVMLNFAFVHLLNMNVDGVALATIISQGVSAFLTLRALMKRSDAIRFNIKEMHIDPESLKSIVKIGVPAGIQSSLYSTANIVIQSSINSFGTVCVTGNSAAVNIEGFAYVVLNAFYHSALTFTGQNMGAKKYSRINKVYLVNVLCVIVSGLSVGILFTAFVEPLLSLYSVTDPVAVEFARTRLFYVCFLYFLCGILDVTTGVLRGIGSSFVPMLICVIGVCGLRILWIATVFSQIHTPEALFVVYPISWAVTFVAEYIAYVIIRKHRQKKGQEIQA